MVKKVQTHFRDFIFLETVLSLVGTVMYFKTSTAESIFTCLIKVLVVQSRMSLLGTTCQELLYTFFHTNGGFLAAIFGA